MPQNRNTRRSDGRIVAQVYPDRGENGKQKYKTVYSAMQKEADEKALQVKLSMKKRDRRDQRTGSFPKVGGAVDRHQAWGGWAQQDGSYRFALAHLAPSQTSPYRKSGR